jgi:hypothetical protein
MQGLLYFDSRTDYCCCMYYHDMNESYCSTVAMTFYPLYKNQLRLADKFLLLFVARKCAYTLVPFFSVLYISLICSF